MVFSYHEKRFFTPEAVASPGASEEGLRYQVLVSLDTSAGDERSDVRVRFQFGVSM